jgi:hypothetical protein
MGDAGVERLEAALSRLESVLAHRAPAALTDGGLADRHAKLEAVTRDAIARIDRLLAPAA